MTLVAASALAALGCRSEGDPGALVTASPSASGSWGRLGAVPVPAHADVGLDCTDVGAARVCWSAPDDAGPLGVIAAPRPPPPSGAPGDWRCQGAGAARTCAPRAASASAFSCSGDRCTQRWARLPDDHEWECAELEGAAVCRSWSTAAGTVPGPPDPGFRCGVVRGKPNERVCVDFAPDRPPGEPWDCRFGQEPGTPSRTCVRGGREPLGRACGAGCPFGAVCAGERCLPLPPRPECWTDRDCPEGSRCAFATCREPPR